MEHLTLEQIHSYIEKQETGKNITEIEGHLASCEKCHRIYIELVAVEQPLSRSFREENATASCPEEWEIGALIQQELPPDVSEGISTHVKDCSFCIDRAAIYYKSLKPEKAPAETPELWKHKAVQALSAGKAVKEQKVPLIQRILDFFQDLTIPVPMAAGYAAALLAVAVLVWIFVPAKARFITIASSEKLVIRDSEIPSAFGFSGTGETKELNVMDISLKGNDIIFKWNPLEGAVEYTFSLKEGDTLIKDKSTVKQPSISLSKDFMEKERLYRWLITGKTGDGRFLEYTGDFILAN